ncbi:hypothetical protein [Cesiribacter sp. SM1]|uniref:hypothetical protein n=1 Tax=Cesiribacter sp. SM1 TaxID=2861196 RepID=UPI001CD6680A|nr:hypothetical protein [Cesiribacter sp. SM1]
MRWTIILLVFITACSPGGDNNTKNDDDAASAPESLHIDFQSGFYQDTVTLFHGREKVYEKVLTTREGQRLTDQFSIPKTELKDTLYFRVGTEKQPLRGHIPPNSAQHVGFYLTSGTVVNIYSREAPFEYD